jgi:hypothetical protein
LVDQYVENFDRRWLDKGVPKSGELLGHADFSGLADLGSSFRVADEMRPVVPGLEQIKAQALATLIPFLVLIPTNPESTGEIIRSLVMKLLG